MDSKKISWESQDGSKDIAIEISASGFTVFVNGENKGSQFGILPPPVAQKAMFAQHGIVGTLCSVMISKERASEIQSIQNELKQAFQSDPVLVFYRLESKLQETHDFVQSHSENSASAYAQEAKAEQDLRNWIKNNPTAYRLEMARRQTDRKRHEEELAQSFLARGLE